MATEPLTPQEVDKLLRPDLSTATADLLMLRDALLRMGDACERLARSAERLQRSARLLEGLAARRAAALGDPAAARGRR